MKEITISVDDDLFDHLEKVSQMVSIWRLTDISVPDLVAKTVATYCKFGLVNIDFSVDGDEIVVETRSSTNKEEDLKNGRRGHPHNIELEKKLNCIDW